MPAANCIQRIEEAMKGASLDDQVRIAEEADRIVRESTGQTEAEILKRLDESILAETIGKKIEAL